MSFSLSLPPFLCLPGAIRSMAGDVIAEFTKEQGNFVTPRGKYGIQMTSTFMHMQGSQYSYKIKYTDIGSLYLLPKLENGREAFVIALEKPIRQGAQRYQYLVLETHRIEHTMTINLTEEEIKSKYDGQLTQEMTMPTSHLIAKIFKILSQTPVSFCIQNMCCHIFVFDVFVVIIIVIIIILFIIVVIIIAIKF